MEATQFRAAMSLHKPQASDKASIKGNLREPLWISQL
jgi:hypothetical protein